MKVSITEGITFLALPTDNWNSFSLLSLSALPSTEGNCEYKLFRKKKILCVNYRPVSGFSPFADFLSTLMFTQTDVEWFPFAAHKFPTRIRWYVLGYRFWRQPTFPFSLKEPKEDDEVQLGHLPIMTNKHLHFRNALQTAKYIPTLQSQICHCRLIMTHEKKIPSDLHPRISTPSANPSMAIPW